MLTDVRVRDQYMLRKPQKSPASMSQPEFTETGILEALAAGHPFGETLFTSVLATWCQGDLVHEVVDQKN